MKLPVIESQTIRPRQQRSANRKRFADFALHCVRLALIALVILGLQRVASLRDAAERTTGSTAIELSDLREFLPGATGLRPLEESSLTQVINRAGEPLAVLATTSPQADEVIGYSGPNNVLLILDSQQRVSAATLLSSDDTAEHAKLVQNNREFWKQFQGLEWGDPEIANLDGVSGATLTSLAILESVGLRMSGQRLSLRFPRTVTLDEAQGLSSEIAKIEFSERSGYECWSATDRANQSLGTIARTGNIVDSIEGYQGPTELLLLINPDDKLSNVRLRSSFDNEPYVGYVRQEYSFWPIFKNRSLSELADINLEAEGIEGVSGATMTSIAVARTIQSAAGRLVSPPETMPQVSNQWHWSGPEIATALIALISIPWSRSRFRSHRHLRLIWQVLCFLTLGVWAGNLISMSLMAGWTRGGIPYRLAPGLALLLVVSLTLPALFRSNVYCDHVCPHGALQQWLRPLKRKRSPSGQIIHTGGRDFALPRSLVPRALQATATVVIALAVYWLISGMTPVPLAWLEPFDSYAWRIGFSFSLCVLILSVAMSLWRPMSYCQLACPTGRLIDTLRRTRRTRMSLVFDVSLALLCLAIWMFAT